MIILDSEYVKIEQVGSDSYGCYWVDGAVKGCEAPIPYRIAFDTESDKHEALADALNLASTIIRSYAE